MQTFTQRAVQGYLAGGWGVGGLRSGCWVGVVVTMKTGLRRWPMKKHADGLRKMLFSKHSVMDFDKSKRSSRNKCQRCVKTQWFQTETPGFRSLFFPTCRSWFFERFFFFFWRFLMRRISCVFWRACGRMPGICRPSHSQAPGPFITRLFNQLAVTKLGPQPLLMLITPTINMAALLLMLNELVPPVQLGTQTVYICLNSPRLWQPPS